MVKIKYTDKDIRKAIFEIINRIYRLWVVSVCFFIVIGSIFIIEIRNGFSGYYSGLIVVLIFIYLIFLAFYYIYPINRYIDVYKQRRESIFIFTDDNIEVFREDIQSLGKWSLFIKVYELNDYFVLRDKNKALTILPKRSFDTESDIQEFRNILRSKMKIYK